MKKFILIKLLCVFAVLGLAIGFVNFVSLPTVYATDAEEETTIADILPEDFPTSYWNAWINDAEGYSKAYIEGENLKVDANELALSTVLTKDGDNYKYIDVSGDVYTFIMESNTLKCINLSLSVSSANGDYSPLEHNIIITKADGTPAIEGNDEDHNNADYYWNYITNDTSMLFITSNDLIVSGEGNDIEYLRIKENVSSITFSNLKVKKEISIFAIEDDTEGFNLTLIGSNQIGNNVTYSDSTVIGDYIAHYGLYFGKTLTIDGTGSLTIYDGVDGIYSFGSDLIFKDTFTGTITVEDAELEEEAEPEPPCAISIGDGSLIINNGTLNLTSYNKNGITAGKIEINGGNIITSGGIKAMSVAPTFGSNIKTTIVASTNFNGESPVEAYDANDIDNYKYIKIETAVVHDLVEVVGKDATCEEVGYKAAYKCSVCGEYFEDQEGTILIGDETAYELWKANDGKINALGHNLIQVTGKEATSKEDGYKDAYKCERCNKYFEDELGTKLIGDENAYSLWKANEGLIEKEGSIEKEGLSGVAIACIIIACILVALIITYFVMFIVWKKKDKAPKFLVKSFEKLNKVFKK